MLTAWFNSQHANAPNLHILKAMVQPEQEKNKFIIVTIFHLKVVKNY